MKINVPQEQQEFIESLIEAGRFANVDEAILESVRALETTEKLRSEIEVGIRAADADDVVGHNDVFSELRQRVHDAGDATRVQ